MQAKIDLGGYAGCDERFRQLSMFKLIVNLYTLVLVAARALATYLIPGCVGRGVRLGSENSSGGVWKSGNLENLGIWRSGDLEIQKFGVQKIKRLRILKIQICSAQNVGKVWISRRKILLAPFGAI